MSGLSGTYSCGISSDKKFTLNFSTYNDKFASDNLHIENDDLVIAIEGCILNTEKLKIQHKENDLFLLISLLWEKHKESITRQLRGSFTLVIYDKNKDYLFVTNDLLSKKPLYIYKSDKLFMFSSKYHDLIDMTKSCNINLSLNKLAVAMMLVRGSLEDSVTYAKEISYVKAYQYVIVCDNKINECNYDINSALLTIDESEIIKELDVLFSRAIEEQFQKNISSNYKQLCTLSAGMDSRACFLYANKMGYKDILCLSYAQSGSIDYLISNKIAVDYNCEYIFYPLDSTTFLYLPDVLCERNECQQAYADATGAYQSFKLIDTSEYGIIHTGSLGGELLSDIFPQPKFTDINYSNKNFKALPIWDEALADEYKNIKSHYSSEEEYSLYLHARLCQNFFRMVDYKCEAFSPFMHEDFFEFTNRIPPELRFRRGIYRKWMNKHIPNDYISTYNKTNLTAGAAKVFIAKAYNKLIRKVIGKNKFDMNPMEYWGKNNPAILAKMNQTYQNELERAANIDDSVKSSLDLEKNKGVVGTYKAITALKAINKIG